MYGRKIERNLQANDFGGRSCEAADSKSKRLIMDLKVVLFFVGTTPTSFFSVGRFESPETVMTHVLFVEAPSMISDLLLSRSVKSRGN